MFEIKKKNITKLYVHPKFRCFLSSRERDKSNKTANDIVVSVIVNDYVVKDVKTFCFFSDCPKTSDRTNERNPILNAGHEKQQN